jgi:hypothetical protein
LSKDTPQSRYRERNREARNKASAEWWAKNGAAYREANREKLRRNYKKWFDAHPGVAAERVNKFLEENPGRGSEYSLKWRKTYPEKRRQSVKKYRASHLDQEKAFRVKWVAANKDKLAAKAAKRRALKFQATPSWVDWEKVLALYSDAQTRTAETGKPYHVDHIVPLKSDIVCGLHWHENMKVIPGIENLSKGNRHWPDCP